MFCVLPLKFICELATESLEFLQVLDCVILSNICKTKVSYSLVSLKS